MSDYIGTKLRKAVDRRKNAGGMRAGLPQVTVDLYELERVLDERDAALARIKELEAALAEEGYDERWRLSQERLEIENECGA